MGFLDNTPLYAKQPPPRAQPAPTQSSPYAEIVPQAPQTWSSATQSERDEDYNRYVEAGAIAPEVHADIKNRVKNYEPFKRQRQTIEEMKDKLSKFSEGGKGVAGNLGTINKFFDYLTGDKHKMSERFGSGISAEEKEKIERYMRSDITKAQQSLGRQKNAFMKNQLLNRYTDGTKQVRTSSDQSGTKSPKPGTGPGTKPLSQTSSTDLADLDAADQMLDNLWKAWQDADALNPASRAKYQSALRPTMQAVGTILEGGKLAAGDEPKYLKMMPNLDYDATPLGDAEGKIKELKRMLKITREERVKKFKESGYKVGGGGKKKQELTPEQREKLGL